MKTTFLFTTLFLAISAIFSQNYLLPDDEKGLALTWMYSRALAEKNDQLVDWESNLTLGYTFHGRLDIAISLFSQRKILREGPLDLFHSVSPKISYAFLKQGLNESPVTITIYSEFLDKQYRSVLTVGSGFYKRFRTDSGLSLTPGINGRYSHAFIRTLSYGYSELELSADIQYKAFTLGPRIVLGELGNRMSLKMGFLFRQEQG